MTSRSRLRSITLAVVLASGVLTACGTSPPPARELADEVIDTLEDAQGEPLSEGEKQCMKDAVDAFELTEQEAKSFVDLDDAAAKADDGNADAKQVIARFVDELGACVTG